jgi:hypothetical protein
VEELLKQLILQTSKQHQSTARQHALSARAASLEEHLSELQAKQDAADFKRERLDTYGSGGRPIDAQHLPQMTFRREDQMLGRVYPGRADGNEAAFSPELPAGTQGPNGIRGLVHDGVHRGGPIDMNIGEPVIEPGSDMDIEDVSRRESFTPYQFEDMSHQEGIRHIGEQLRLRRRKALGFMDPEYIEDQGLI